MTKPVLIVIDGAMGSGKTTISKMLHKKMDGSVLISLDRLKFLLSNCKVDSKVHLGFADDIGRLIAKKCLKDKRDVIVEKAFTREEFLLPFINALKNYSKVYVYQLHAPLEIRIERIKQRPPSSDTGKWPTKAKIKRNNKNFEEFRYKNAKEFDTTKLTSNQIVNKILKEVNKK